MAEDSSDNPFAAPATSEPSLAPSVPLSNYFYGAVLFCIGAFVAAFAMFLVSVLLDAAFGVPAPLLIAMHVICSIAFGWHTGLRMFRRLQELHEQKLQLEREQSERLGEFHIW